MSSKKNKELNKIIKNKSYLNARKNFFKAYPGLESMSISVRENMRVSIHQLNDEVVITRDVSGMTSEAYLNNNAKSLLVELNLSSEKVSLMEKEIQDKLANFFERAIILRIRHGNAWNFIMRADGSI